MRKVATGERSEARSESPRFTLPLMDAVKLGSIIVTLAGAFFVLQGNIASLRTEASESHKLALQQADRLDALGRQLNEVAISDRILHEDFQNLGRALYEKSILKSPDVAFKIPAPGAPLEAFVPFEDDPPPVTGRRNLFLEVPKQTWRGIRFLGRAAAKTTTP